MDTITTFEGFLWTIADLAVSVKHMAIKFAVIFAMMTAVYGVIKFYMGFEDEQKLNLRKYVYIPLILVFILANYGTLIDITGRMGAIMVNSSPGNDIHSWDMLSTMQKFNWTSAGDRIKEAGMELEVEESFTDKIGTFFQSAGKTLTALYSYPARAIWSFLQFGFVKICRIVIVESRNVLLGFLIVVGPLAIVFSILPLFRENFKKWFRMYVAVILWSVTINIMDAMIIGYYKNANEFQLSYIYANPDGTTYTSETKLDEETILGIHSINGIEYGGMENGFINFVFAMMYLMVPLLTAFYIGDKMAASFLSFMVQKTVGSVMDTGKMAINAATGGVSMVGTKLGSGGTTSGLK
ncbi:MAG: hypothetical protein ACWA6U_16595 [Breznakibacter sp.]